MQNKQTAPELRTLFGFMKQIFILLFPHQQKCPVQIQCSIPPLGIWIAERFLALCPADEDRFYGNAGEGCVISLGEPPGEEAGHSSGGDGGGYGGACFPGEGNGAGRWDSFTDGAVCLPGQAGSAGQNPRSLHVDAGGSKVRLDLSGGGEAAAAVDVEDAGDMIVCADGQKQRRISWIGDGDVRVRTEKAGVLREKSLHGEPDMKLPGDKQRGIDPDMPDAGGRAGKTQKS